MNFAITWKNVRTRSFSWATEAILASTVFALCMFATGASGYICEMLLATVSSYVLENTIIQFAIIVGLMMFFMGISQYAQSIIPKKKLIESFISIELTLSLLCGFTPLIIYGAFAYTDNHFEIIQYSLAGSIGFLVGFEIPIVLRINEKYADSLPTNISRTTTFDYVGVAFGLSLWIYLLKKGVVITEISFIAAAINLSVAVLALWFFGKYNLLRKKRKWALLWILTALLLVFGYQHNREWSALMKQRLFQDKIILDEQTMFQNVVLTYRKEIDAKYLYLNGQTQFSTADEIRYHEPLVHPVMSLVLGQPEKVLILGGGDGMALREILKYKNLKSVTLVELDARMIELFRDNTVLAELNDYAFRDPRVKVINSNAVTPSGVTPVYLETDKLDKNKRNFHEKTGYVHIMSIDADKFIGEVKGRWDVIIIDLPDPSTVEVAKLYSQEFYMKLRRILTDYGMVAVQSTSPYHAKEAFLGINRTIKASGFNTLPYRNNVPSFGDWGWLLCWKDHIPIAYVEKKIAEMEFRVKTDFLTAKQARTFFYNWGKGELESEITFVNTHMEPALLWAYLDECWKID